MSAYAVIGHPIGHTMSPFIHKRLFALSGIDAAYTTRDIAPENLARELPRLLETVGGVNVTIPHKQAVIPLLTRLEGRAAIYRSVNTIAVTGEGPVGHNTDAAGFLHALREGGAALAGRVAILGCGGVGRTFACEAALAGCAVVNAVRPADRSAAEALRQFVLELAPGVDYTIVELEELNGAFDLLINATPVGMYPHSDAMPVSAAALEKAAAVFDAVYNPRRTRLLEAAAANGAVAIGGMAMLVWQAADAQTIWLGTRFDPAAVAGVIEESLAEMERVFHA
ncbi:MAG: shikimate dehydrogenase family protein [Acutalibacteraceae bacterium]|jgi:shikimate dehydrogenase